MARQKDPLPDSTPWTVKNPSGKPVAHVWKKGESAKEFAPSTNVGEVLGAARKYRRETGLHAEAVRT